MYSHKLGDFSGDRGKTIGGKEVGGGKEEQSRKPFVGKKNEVEMQLSGKPPGAEKIKLFLSLPRLFQIMLNYRRQIFIHVHNVHAIQPLPAVKLIAFPWEPMPFGFGWPCRML